MEMANKIVADDEIENVGIMDGFMEDIEGLMDEIAEAEGMVAVGSEEDMSEIMDRRPDSPEILMNNLRGDYRSVDARREELADLVGFNAASETPDDVLALLQPVLAGQQEGVASLGALSPETMVPVGGGGPFPPPPPSGLPMPPPAPAPEGIGSLPMGMANGGYVQNFQDGSGSAGVTPVDANYAAYPPEVVEAAKARVMAMLEQQPSAVPNLKERTTALQPEYAELLGLQDKDAMKAQMLFDIGQAALNFGGNVDPQGKPLRGSMAARLAGATSALPGKIGARAAEMQKADQTARLAAMQAAQGEIDAARAANVQLGEDQMGLITDIAKAKSSRLLTNTEKTDRGLDVSLPWQIDQTGALSLPGGRPQAPVVDMGSRAGEAAGITLAIEGTEELYNNARDAARDVEIIDETIRLIEEGDVDTGFGANLRQKIRGVQSLWSDKDLSRLSDTQLLNAALGTAVFGAIQDLGIGARGMDTEGEREFLREVLAGRIELTKETLLRMTAIRRRSAAYNIEKWNEGVDAGRFTQAAEFSGGFLPLERINLPPIPSGGYFEEGPGSDQRQRVLDLIEQNRRNNEGNNG